MNKKNLFGLMLTIFASSQLMSLAQNPAMVPPPPAPGKQVTAPVALPQTFPPIILISGKERESFQKVFIDKVKAGEQISVKLLTFDREPKEEVKVNSYGLPDSAKLDVKNGEGSKNRAEINLTWKTKDSDKGFHTIIIEAVNSKDAASRVSLSYDVQ